jgi:hypothetical protein
MGLFAFRRMRELEAASKEVASFPVEEPATVEVAPEVITEPVNGNCDRGNGRRGRRKLLPDAG